MKNFEVGDTVRCIKEYDGNKKIVGEQGVVKASFDYVGVEFFNNINGHGGCGKIGRCWNFSEYDGGYDCLEFCE